MRWIRILPLLAMVPLLGCDAAGDSLGGSAAATAYAAPLADDTTVVTTRRVWSSSEPDSVFSPDLGMIMPNGTEMAGTHWLTGDPAVFDLVNREFRVFRMNDEPYDTGIALYAVPSPDGSRVAFEWTTRADSLTWSGSQLRILDVATGESKAIMTSDTAVMNSLMPVAWTPEGDSVFVTGWHRDRGDVEVVLVPVADGTPRLLHTISQSSFRGDMALSPDGRWLLYANRDFREQQTRSNIYLIDVQGGGARPLLQLPDLDWLVGWLPGTDVVLFSSDRSGTTDLWSVRVVNGHASAELRQVRSGFLKSYGLGFGDGALFYSVQTGVRGIAVIDVDPQSGAFRGAASTPLPHLSSPPRGLKWSADGRTLAALTAWGPGSDAITVHDMKTGESRVFRLNGNVISRAFEWAPDGKTLLLRVAETGHLKSPTHFLRLDLVTGSTTRLFAADEPQEPEGPGYLDFLVTPDGRSIVLRQQRVLDDGRTQMKLVLRSLEDSRERELHRTSGFIPEFRISADGTRLAFMQQVWENSDSLFVMRMDGSEPIRYVASWDYDEVSLLGWLPAGNALLAARLTGPYTSGDAEDGPGEEILRIELDGSATLLGLSPFRPGRGVKHVPGAHRSRLLLSPAGNGLAHSVSESGQELWRMDGLHELFAEDTTGRR